MRNCSAASSPGSPSSASQPPCQRRLSSAAPWALTPASAPCPIGGSAASQRRARSACSTFNETLPSPSRAPNAPSSSACAPGTRSCRAPRALPVATLHCRCPCNCASSLLTRTLAKSSTPSDQRPLADALCRRRPRMPASRRPAAAATSAGPPAVAPVACAAAGRTAASKSSPCWAAPSRSSPSRLARASWLCTSAGLTDSSCTRPCQPDSAPNPCCASVPCIRMRPPAPVAASESTVHCALA